MHTAVREATPSLNKVTKKFNTDEWISMYYHLVLNSLKYIKVKFEREYGDIIICVDSSNNWRKQYYPDYKGNRESKRNESKINYDEFFNYSTELIEAISSHFPFKTLKIDTVEADDIIGVLSKEFRFKEKTLAISSDKDFKQILKYGVKLFDPISKIYVNMTDSELKEWELFHIIAGDEVDNIPNIKQGTEFSPEFKTFLSQKGIYKDIAVHEFLDLTISKKLFEEFDIYDVNRNGIVQTTKKIYKKIPFGEVGINKFIKDFDHNMGLNPMYKVNFERNKQLILFDMIPEDIVSKILVNYNEAESHFDTIGIMQFLGKYHLMELIKSASDFYQNKITKQQTQPTTSAIDDWN